MLVFTSKLYGEYTWHVTATELPDGTVMLVPDAKPCLNDDYLTDVVDVYANGHELDYVKSHFTGLPMRLGTRAMTWRGDFAQFIYDNIR